MRFLTTLGTIVGRLALRATGRLQELLATLALLLLQPLLRHAPIPLHVDDDPAQQDRARAEFTAEALAAALTAGLVHLDNGEPLRRPVVVNTTDDRVDSMRLALDGLIHLDDRRRERDAAAVAQRQAEWAALRLERSAQAGKIRPLT